LNAPDETLFVTSLARIAAALLFAVTGNHLTAAEPDAGLELKQTILLPGVEGRIDHLDFDPAGERLFVCALGNNTVEVLDLRQGERVHSIRGLGSPQGLAFIPELNRLLIANDKDGLCNIYDAKSWRLIDTVDFQDDADNVRYDSATKRIYVGFGAGGIGVINASDGKRVGSIKLAAHPEAFELEKRGRRIFANAPDAGQVAVIDRDKGEVISTWKPDGASANFPMALDEANHRLFIACRNPAKLVVLNTDSGDTVTTLDISGDADEVFYDSKRQRLYVICGAGSVDIIERTDSDHYKLALKVPTASGARTGLFVPERDDLFIAVPHRGAQPAEIRRYQLR
jgi:DNA-binding beta-propeller fold protein YncE